MILNRTRGSIFITVSKGSHKKNGKSSVRLTKNVPRALERGGEGEKIGGAVGGGEATTPGSGLLIS